MTPEFLASGYLAGCAAYVPETRITIDEARARGFIDDDDARATAYASITVEDALFPAEMAVRAARAAIARARLRPEDVALCVYSATHRHGHRFFWSPAAYLQREIGAEDAFAINVSAGCTAQMAASELALAYLAARPQRRAVLVVAADRYSASPINRWKSDYGLFLADGAAAAVYGRDPGVARVLSIHSQTVGELEAVHRMGTELPQTSENWMAEYNIRETKKRYMAENGTDRLKDATNRVTERLLDRCLEEAGLTRKDIRYFVLPNLGRKLMEATYFNLCEGRLDRCLWESLGRRIGHVGPADQVIGLTYLLETGAVCPGDVVALIGAGAGFTWSCMLLRIEPHDVTLYRGP
jgi:3-oxoacyl-[acyl-carrier-protein] synthase-3